jgi:hypothetical protein
MLESDGVRSSIDYDLRVYDPHRVPTAQTERHNLDNVDIVRTRQGEAEPDAMADTSATAHLHGHYSSITRSGPPLESRDSFI